MMCTFEELSELKDNWDGEDAPPPTKEAIANARAVVAQAFEVGYDVDEIDADVMGGVAVYITGIGGRTWIACMNSGVTTAVDVSSPHVPKRIRV
jgi:hypothetical protein